MNQIALYTVLTGAYDVLRQPEYIDDNIVYICFTNDDIDEEKLGIWNRRIIPVSGLDNQRLSRFPKLNPHLVLPDFEYSVYMDANLSISSKNFYWRIKELVDSKVLFAGVKNGWRQCTYDEGFRCILSRLDTPSKILLEMRYLKKEGFPENYGMYEANLIFRKHNDNIIKTQSEMWWNTVQRFARRDQLCLAYTLWKCELPWMYFFPDGSNTHNNSSVTFYEHPHRSLSSKSFSMRSLLTGLKPIMERVYKMFISLGW